jgi:hypothetical protein
MGVEENQDTLFFWQSDKDSSELEDRTTELIQPVNRQNMLEETNRTLQIIVVRQMISFLCHWSLGGEGNNKKYLKEWSRAGGVAQW